MAPFDPGSVTIGSRRRFLGLSAKLLAAGAALKLTACGSGQPLTVGSHVWPGYEFLFLADREGWLPPDRVRLLQTGSATESLQALAEGRIAAATLTLDEVLRGRNQGIPLSVVLLFDISAGADAVLSKRRLKSLEQLRGLRIGVETSALGSLVLHKTLSMAGLRRSDVRIVPITVNDHVKAWTSDTLDVLITYEPTASKLEATGAIRLLDSRRFPDTIFDTLAVNWKSAQHHGSGIRSLVSAHFQAVRSWQRSPSDCARQMAAHLGIEPDGVVALYRGLELPDLDYNRHLLEPPAEELQHAVATILEAAPDIGPPGLDGSAVPLFMADYLP